MKSNLFSTLDLKASESFSKDIKHLIGVDSKILGKITEYSLQFYEVPTRSEEVNICEKASEETGLPRASLDHIIHIIQFFLRQLTSKGEANTDDPESLVSDLNELFGLPDEKRDAFIEFFNNLKTISKSKVEILAQQRSHEQLTLPMLESISTKVDFRAMFDDDYQTYKDISTFSPKFLGIIPLGIIRLTLSDKSDEVYLQANKRMIQLIIDHLVALQKQINIAEKYIDIKEADKDVTN